MTETKDSGAPWLGSVPASWEVLPAKRLLWNPREREREDDELLTPSQKFGVLPQEEYMRVSGSRVVMANSDSGSGVHVEEGDFISHLRSFQGGLEYSGYTGKVSPAYTVLRPSRQIHPGYYKHLFKSSMYVQALQTTTDQLRDGQSIRYQQFGRIPLPLPPLDEQRRIADYLSQAVSLIDDLSARYEALSKVVEHRSNAEIIAWATGANSTNLTAPEKTVPWVKVIPANWEVRPIYWVGREVKRPNPLVEHSTILSLSYGNLVKKKATNEGLNPETYDSYQLIKPGDIVFRFTDLQNDQKSLRSAVATQEGLITSAYMAFEPQRLLPEFFGYLMRAYDLLGAFYGMGSGLRQSLRFTEIRTMPTLVPPLDEQKRIIKHLDYHFAVSRTVRSRSADAVRQLAERKASLISSVVRGRSR